MQRIPPSGGAPAYKLTLPHGIVTQQLAHFIDTTFELAATEESCKCWQGRIGARRNKERSEFVLQVGCVLNRQSLSVELQLLLPDHVLYCCTPMCCITSW